MELRVVFLLSRLQTFSSSWPRVGAFDILMLAFHEWKWTAVIVGGYDQDALLGPPVVPCYPFLGEISVALFRVVDALGPDE